MPEEREIAYHEVTLRLCAMCLDGKGGECHSPGCALWINRAPDLPLRDHPFVHSIDGQAWNSDFTEREAPTCLSTEELRDACEQAVRELWGEDAEVLAVPIDGGTSYDVMADAGLGIRGGVTIEDVADERDAWEQLLVVLLMRLAQRGDR